MKIPYEMKEAHEAVLAAIREYGRVRKKYGFCIVTTCHNMAEPGKVRCRRCLDTINRGVKKHHQLHTCRHTRMTCSSCNAVIRVCRCTGVLYRELKSKDRCKKCRKKVSS